MKKQAQINKMHQENVKTEVSDSKTDIQIIRLQSKNIYHLNLSCLNEKWES